MKGSSPTYAPTSCWTCRRRRVKCDRELPGCYKCVIRKEQCQGYSESRPLRWANGVASRGKLMGKCVPYSTATKAPVTLVMSLTDPVMQDLSPIDRQYIKYFDRYCSVESALYDSNATNPFREFIRLIPASNALPHTMISIAALHQAKRKSDNSSMDLKLENSPTMGDHAGLVSFNRRKVIEDDPLATYDCLKHKHYALNQIQKDIMNPNARNIEGTIASVLLLVWQDMMDSGKDSWKLHLDALREIAEAVKALSFNFKGLEQYFEMTYAAMHILGTTFVKSKNVYQPLFSTTSAKELMKLSDSEVWAGCPAELLYLVSTLNNISRSQSLPTGFLTQIVPAFDEFSPIKWAVRCSQPSLMKPRYHLASVYKQAVTIYMSQVFCQLPVSTNVGMTTPISLESAMFHIQAISPEDSHLKGLVWPAFVIGAESNQTSHRMVIVWVFERLWDIWRCENIRNALDVLQDLWARNDETSNPAPWIGEIYRSGMDWIFV